MRLLIESSIQGRRGWKNSTTTPALRSAWTSASESFGLEPTASRTTRTATPPRARSVKALSNSEAIFPDQKM